MPESFSGTDVIVYKITKFLSPYLGNVSPNAISIASLLMMIPIMHNLYYNGTVVNTLLLVFVKQFLDCLDGTVAREHNKMSARGVAVDFVCDYLSGIIYLSFIIHLFKKNKKYRKNIGIVVVALALTYWIVDDLPTLFEIIKCANNDNADNPDHKCGMKDDYNVITKLLHDNSVVVQILGALLVKINV